MADKDGKKKPTGSSTDSKAGRTLRGGVTKAWKQGLPPEARKPKAQTKTEERQRRDEEIRLRRERKRQEGIARRAAQREARDQLEAQRRAEEAQAETTAEALTKLTGVKRAPKKAAVKEVQVVTGRRSGKTTAAKKQAEKEGLQVVFSSADFHAAQNEEWDREEKAAK